jgi:hypothetical protein
VNYSGAKMVAGRQTEHTNNGVPFYWEGLLLKSQQETGHSVKIPPGNLRSNSFCRTIDKLSLLKCDQ